MSHQRSKNIVGAIALLAGVLLNGTACMALPQDDKGPASWFLNVNSQGPRVSVETSGDQNEGALRDALVREVLVVLEWQVKERMWSRLDTETLKSFKNLLNDRELRIVYTGLPSKLPGSAGAETTDENTIKIHVEGLFRGGDLREPHELGQLIARQMAQVLALRHRWLSIDKKLPEKAAAAVPEDGFDTASLTQLARVLARCDARLRKVAGLGVWNVTETVDGETDSARWGWHDTRILVRWKSGAETWIEILKNQNGGVVIRREDHDGPKKGLQVTYVGKMDAKGVVTGTVTYDMGDQRREGRWTATPRSQR